jgi:DNA-binding response OmpR family regulator
MSDLRRVLLLEDDPNLGLIIQESLEGRGFDVTLCRDGREGLDAYSAEKFDLCLVDVMMPAMDGFEFAGKLRGRAADQPLIFLTARSLTEDRLTGLRLGADDYITKPFSMEELLLRIEAVLRRTGRTGTAMTGPLALGAFTFDPDAQTLTLGEEVRPLTDRESGLLQLLAVNQGKVLERSAALKHLWGDDTYHAGRSMDVFVSRLRKLLADDPTIEIRAVHGRGLKLIVRD